MSGRYLSSTVMAVAALLLVACSTNKDDPGQVGVVATANASPAHPSPPAPAASAKAEMTCEQVVTHSVALIEKEYGSRPAPGAGAARLAKEEREKAIGEGTARCEKKPDSLKDNQKAFACFLAAQSMAEASRKCEGALRAMASWGMK